MKDKFLELLNRHLPQLTRTTIVFLGTGVLANGITEIVVANTTLTIAPTTELTINLSIAALVSVLFWVWDRGQLSLKNLTKEFRNLTATHKEEIKRALLSSSIAETYSDLPTRVVDSLVKKHVDGLKDEERLESRAHLLAEELSERVRKNNCWYPILNHFLDGGIAGMRDRPFNLSLETYLKIYLDLMHLYIDRAEENELRLHIWSFTNAISTDWFVSDSHQPGNVMREFSNRKEGLINKMYEKGFVMRMITLVTSDKSDPSGIRSLEEEKRAWSRLTEEQRFKYLDRLHTKPTDAFRAVLSFEELGFFDGLSEFIFFGFSPIGNAQDQNNIDWELCITGGFSSWNQVLPARYLFLQDKENASYRPLFDISNHQGLKRSDDISPPPRLQVPFKEWPVFVMHDEGYGAISVEQYVSLLPFARKWDLAADIWHSAREREEIKAFLAQVLNGKTNVLDAAAGTGFHCEILLDLNKQVTALEVSEGEKNILLEKVGASQLRTINGDWRTLSEDLAGEQFEAIICLGTSIPYHSSWTELTPGRAMTKINSDTSPIGTTQESARQEKVLRGVISHFRDALHSKGVLVLGLSRHNEKSRTGVRTAFQGEVDGKAYVMDWTFEFDWEKRRRLWRSSIRGDEREYKFELIGHLFEHEELADICTHYFERVHQVYDLDPEHYDKYIVCENPKAITNIT
uniref:Methyltransferase domain-containing protein n=1 Tax=Candidatus Kentrum sp. MB TaxID=2138164 RepID=A0A451BEJ3_9GAMM|nr:MAG: hypothetical protein BECKMB1821G_GA0114241_10659 [Candidatus Kentron sp. MB]VFK34417.1 MAG: hypothetical protein BECKMB1821I_GA0114274_107113 [Candidatus Kentron sp. MB]VFK76705.1 MAG: hypothetical protein BECKMB1821H_GA0114242_10709 [Candidatus Kentron sp. MB]